MKRSRPRKPDAVQAALWVPRIPRGIHYHKLNRTFEGTIHERYILRHTMDNTVATASSVLAAKLVPQAYPHSRSSTRCEDPEGRLQTKDVEE